MFLNVSESFDDALDECVSLFVRTFGSRGRTSTKCPQMSANVRKIEILNLRTFADISGQPQCRGKMLRLYRSEKVVNHIEMHP